MRLQTQDTPPTMTLTASNAREEKLLSQAFGLSKSGDSITLVRKDTPSEENPGAFIVSCLGSGVAKAAEKVKAKAKTTKKASK